MGWSPRIVDTLSLWEMAAAIDGWNRAQGREDEAEAMTDAEFDDLLTRVG